MIKVTVADVYQQDDTYVALLQDEEGRRVLPVKIEYLEARTLATPPITTSILTGYGSLAAFLHMSGGRLEEVYIHMSEEKVLVATVRLLYEHILREVLVQPGAALALNWYAKGNIYVEEGILERPGMVSLAGERVPALNVNRHKKQRALAGSVNNWILFSEPYNLDFSNGTVNWFITGSHPHHYEIGIDSSSVRDEKRYIYLRSRQSKPEGFGALTQIFLADKYRGKQIRFSGSIKTEGSATRAGLWMRVDESRAGETEKRSNLANRWDQTTTQTGCWQQQEVILPVPPDGLHISLGVALQGEGLIWLKEVEFNIFA